MLTAEEQVAPQMCSQCNEYYAGDNGKCSQCTNPPKFSDEKYNPGLDFHPMVEFTKYMETKRKQISWTLLTDRQFELVAKKLTTDVPPIEWYKLLHGLTQDFPAIYLSAAQAKQLINSETEYKYVHEVYRHCYELWDADVDNKPGNCYWRDFAEMTKPKSIEKLHEIYDRMFNGWGNHSQILVGECPICFEDMKSYDVWPTKCCHNAIHTKCISKCKECPFCRGEFYKK